MKLTGGRESFQSFKRFASFNTLGGERVRWVQRSRECSFSRNLSNTTRPSSSGCARKMEICIRVVTSVNNETLEIYDGDVLKKLGCRRDDEFY